MQRLSAVVMAAAMLLVVGPLGAQGSSQNVATPAASQAAVVVLDGTVDPARSLRAPAPNARLRLDKAPAPSPIPHIGTRDTEFMVIGGAAMLVGAVVGGSGGEVLMLGGAVIGLIGLWNYLT